MEVEVIRKNLSAFRRLTEGWKEFDYRRQLEKYITMHDDFISNRRMCVVGSLAPSFDTLPEAMQQELQKLIHAIIDWLADLLSKGKESGIFTFTDTPHARAYLIHSGLLSALLMNKVLRNDVYASIQTSLSGI